ncbi:MAG: glutamate racemase [Angelakisella sp.]
MNNAPIGVFDSGLGGLTAVKELRALLPHEDIIYFGDTGRVPYGGRSYPTITRYAFEDATLLLQKGVKAVLSACGTVSAVAGEQLNSRCPCPYVEVVDPAVTRAVAVSVTGRIGVIATRATIGSGKFQQALEAALPGAQVTAVACPLFVPLVEEGHIAPNDPLVRQVVELYLAELRHADVDTLILGCTHYPLLAEAIGHYLGSNVVLVDSGREGAKAMAAVLRQRELLSEHSGDTHSGTCRYYLTDSTQHFKLVAKAFLGEEASGPVEQVALETLEGTEVGL